MDCSTVSEYENASTAKQCSESVLYETINNILTATTVNGNRIFCPFCVTTYEFKYSLLDHLRNNHFGILSQAAEKSFILEQCPFCYANFFGRHTVIKHVLCIHSKLISHLYLDAGSDSIRNRCLFCRKHLHLRQQDEFVAHIEGEHFLQFTELFEEQFLKGNASFSPPETVISKNSSQILGKDKCFDFSNMKEQLCNVDTVDGKGLDLKSVLKCKKTKPNMKSPPERVKVCRILQFDIPNENKENSVLNHNINSSKHITFAEHTLLCQDNGKDGNQLFTGSTDSLPKLSIEPLHCSTPKFNFHNKNNNDNARFPDNLSGGGTPVQRRKKLKLIKKPTFKSYFCKKNLFYQCGKCKRLFQENIQLNSHIKKNHKVFILNLLHPCYQCAICRAKFFKNRYLEKHVVTHSIYKESLMTHFK